MMNRKHIKQYKYYKILSIALLTLLLFGCDKYEDSTVIPDSLPKLLVSKSKRFVKKSHYLTSYIVPDPIRNQDVAVFLEQSSVQDIREQAVAIAFLTTETYQAFDQINFLKNKYPGLERVHLLPFYRDINDNGSFDLSFFLEYKDSLVLGVFDIINPKSERWLRWKTFGREDGNYLVFLVQWLNTADSSFNIVFRKSNRLSGEELHVDTVICYDVVKDIYKFRMPFGGQLLARDDPFSVGNSIIFHSSKTRNGTSYNGFDDSREHIIAFSDDGSILWSKMITDENEDAFISYYNIIADTTLFISAVVNKDETRIRTFSTLTGDNVSDKILTNQYKFIAASNQNKYLISQELSSNKINMWNSNLNRISTNDMNLVLINKISDVGFGGLDLNVKSHYTNNKFDINNDSYEDILLSTAGNQMVCIDGKTMGLLFATQQFEDSFNYSFYKLNSGEVILLVIKDNQIEYYFIEDTPFFVKILPHYRAILLFIGIFIFLPFTILFIRKIRYFSELLKLLTTLNWDQGIITIGRNMKIISCNKKAMDLVLKGSELVFDNFQHDIKNELSKVIYEKKTYSEKNLTIYNPEKILLIVKTISFKPFVRTVYYLIIINDITSIVDDQQKQNMLTTALMIAHGVKSSLGTAQLQIGQLHKKLKQENIKEMDYYNMASELIAQSISEAADTIRRINYIAKETSESSLDLIDLNDLINDWMNANAKRYKNRGIEIKNNINSQTPKVLINPTSFDLLLLTVCDNSVEAMPYKKMDKWISFNAEVLDNDLIIKITDNGIGMSNETLERIVASPGYSTKRTGSGLGMQLIRKVINEHNAQFFIESSPEIGTTMIIQLTIQEQNNE
jgi:signal transduction histidine kinase